MSASKAKTERMVDGAADSKHPARDAVMRP